MFSPISRNYPNRLRGFSLIELLVGMAISLIAVIVIYQVFTSTQSARRTAAGVSIAQDAGAASLYMLERDIRQAGYGIQLPDMWGTCDVDFSDDENAAGSFPFVPFTVTQGTSDTLTVFYGNAATQGEAVPLVVGVTGAADVVLENAQFFNPLTQELFIVAEAGRRCSLSQVAERCMNDTILKSDGTTDIPAGTCSGTNSQWIRHSTDTRFNRNFTESYTAGTGGGLVMSVGSRPTLTRYSVGTNPPRLLRDEILFPERSSDIADDIVNLQVQIGFNDGTYADDMTGHTWADVTALRVAAVARSNVLEKTEVSPAQITVFEASGDTDAVVLDFAGEQRRYRYKVYQTVVPLRNLLWRP